MADAGTSEHKRDGAEAGSSPARPCCGLPSPLASAIRSTVRSTADGAVAAAPAPAGSGGDGREPIP